MNLFKKIGYKALDAATFGRGISRTIGGHKTKFPAEWSRYYEADYEPETFLFLERYLKPGHKFLDIGAHIGLFSVLAAKRVGKLGKVYAFEPTPFTRNVLKEMIALNQADQIVEVREEAVAEKSGITTFFDTGDAISNANSLVKTFRSRNGIEVPMTSVDEFVRQRNLKIDCLKIDVEGAELDLLRGARETFMTIRPIARLGLHPPAIFDNGQSLEEIWALLEEYRLNPEFEGNPVERAWFCDQPELFDVNLLPV